MHRSRSIAAACLVLLGIATAANAEPLTDSPSSLPSVRGFTDDLASAAAFRPVVERLRRTEEIVDDVRALAKGGDLSGLASAGARMEGVEAGPASIGSVLQVSASTDGAVPWDMIDGIALAVDEAARSVGPVATAARSPHTGVTITVDPSVPLTDPAEERVREIRPPHMPELHHAAAAVARMIQEAIPALTAAGARLRANGAGGTVAGCDLVDQLPTMCVGGPGANTYTKDAQLLIDLGGDDTYLQSAGGADPGRNGLAVSVAIDVAGNDKYAAAMPLKSGARVAQGAAAGGGIGMLVDVAGDDSYSIKSSPTSTKDAPLGSVGQGAAVYGFGMLADTTGDDTYELDTTAVAALGAALVPSVPPTLSINPGGQPVGAMGLGAGFFGSGIFSDASGDDEYVVRTHPTRGLMGPGGPVGGFAFAGAYGFGTFGSGLFTDLGGNDSMKLLAIDRVTGSDVQAPDAAVVGFGAGSAGGGIAILGPGSAEMEAIADTNRPAPHFDPRWPSSSSVSAFGVGFSLIVPPAYGALIDAGGDDSYVARATAQRRSGLDFSNAVVAGMGMGAGAGVGLLHDVAGNDRYDSRATAWSKHTGIGVSYVQGVGNLEGAGQLVDGGGDDLYSSIARGVANIRNFSTTSYAQAVGIDIGLGILSDGDGSDRYTTSNLYELLGQWRPTSSEVQASVRNGGALLLDIDGGASDRFTAEPKDPTCGGKRGEASWTDCGSYQGNGYTF